MIALLFFTIMCIFFIFTHTAELKGLKSQSYQATTENLDLALFYNKLRMRTVRIRIIGISIYLAIFVSVIISNILFNYPLEQNASLSNYQWIKGYIFPFLFVFATGMFLTDKKLREKYTSNIDSYTKDRKSVVIRMKRIALIRDIFSILFIFGVILSLMLTFSNI